MTTLYENCVNICTAYYKIMQYMHGMHHDNVTLFVCSLLLFISNCLDVHLALHYEIKCNRTWLTY